MIPLLRKPPVASAVGALTVHELASDSSQPIFLRQVGGWDLQWQRLLFRVLVPIELLVRFGIDPITLTDAQGKSVARLKHGEDDSSIRLELYHSSEAQDAMGELELSDTRFNQIEVVWLAIQNPLAPRFDIDVMPSGEPTMRGTASRNIAAEEAAMAAGLAPGQIRKGLGTLRWLGERLELLMLNLNQREYIAQPLYYHTAVLFEQLGFGYILGQARMEQIAEGFAPGGCLSNKLDGCGPFRRPELADTVRGRSWAIHDGILDQPWDRVRMVKRLGVHAGVNTCPGIPW